MAKETVESCLHNETIVVKHIARDNTMVGHNPRHVLYAGMAETSYRDYTVPMLRNGDLKDVLTKNEKAFLESYMGLHDDALSVYRKADNYWKNYTVRLFKSDNYLDLNKPEDYIKYKVLLANDNAICPSLKHLQDFPKASYEYVMIAQGDEAKAVMTRVNARKEAYKEYGKIEDNIPMLRLIVETMTGRAVAPTAKKEQLAERIDTLIENDAKMFLNVVRDPYINTKVLIREGITAGAIIDKAGQLYLKDGNVPLCDGGEATLSVAAEFLNKPKNQEMKFSIEAKIKAYNDNK